MPERSQFAAETAGLRAANVAVDPRQLEAFIAVAEELNINRAAARLHMTQPPLTRRIKRLERDVGASLFRRTAGGMEITEPGAVLLERAYRIVALSASAIEKTRRARAGEIGHLAVGYYDPAIIHGIPALLNQFLDQHPGVTVSFELVRKRTQIEYLRDKLLHIGFGRVYHDEPGISCRSVISEDLYVAVKGSEVTEPRQAMSVSDLRGQPLIIYPPTRPGFGDEVIRMCLEAGFAPVVAVEAEDVIACLAYVAIGSAIAVVPESAAKTNVHGVTFVPLIDAPPSRLNCVYLTANRAPTLALFRAFLEAQT
jgi:LysR family transcriptional regulator, benzoate and cis,cis-muconate-responsive activator of ben and cat genes